MSGLRWEEQRSGGWIAYSGDIAVGMVVHVEVGPEPRPWVWTISAVSMRWVAKGRGEAAGPVNAKRALANSWATWLKRAGLAPK